MSSQRGQNMAGAQAVRGSNRRKWHQAQYAESDEDGQHDGDVSASDYDSTYEEETDVLPAPNRRQTLKSPPIPRKSKPANQKPRSRSQNQDQMIAMPQQRMQQQIQPAHAQVVAQSDGKKNPLTIRLDINLEVEITIHAKIHGDLTLSLL